MKKYGKSANSSELRICQSTWLRRSRTGGIHLVCSHEFVAVPHTSLLQFSLPNFTHVTNNVLCSARLGPAQGAVLSLLVMLMTFACMWAVVPWWKLMHGHNAVPICYYKSHEA